MRKYLNSILSKYMLIMCAMCLVGTVLSHNVSYAQSSTTTENIKLAGNANARALFAQAKKYHDGDGVQQDLSKARFLYLKAAGMGHNDARINLGYLYFMGQGVEQDYIKARNWYLGAANNGDKSAQENLAMMYEHGLGVDKDPTQVKYWREFGTSKPVAELKIKPKENTVRIDDVVPEIVSVPEAKVAVIAEQNPIILVSSSPVISNIVPDLRVSDVLHENAYADKLGIPVWGSNTLVGFMLLLALITGAWFVVQYAKLKEQKKAYVFAKAFYAHHRDQLRINYLRYPTHNRKHDKIDDLWAGALCTLMVRFAQKQEGNQGLVGEHSDKIVKALAQSSFKARQAVFPFVKITQQKIFADIQAYDFKPKPQLTPQLVRRPRAKTSIKSATTRASNVVNLHASRNKKPPSIPPESLWPDSPGS